MPGNVAEVFDSQFNRSYLVGAQVGHGAADSLQGGQLYRCALFDDDLAEFHVGRRLREDASALIGRLELVALLDVVQHVRGTHPNILITEDADVGSSAVTEFVTRQRTRETIMR